jgi:hypothetical protein
MFEEFCRALPLSGTQRSSIASRTATITRRLNSDFRATASDTANRFYAGSYGRNTALASVSDIDLMYVLPYSTYVQYNAYANNKQSALLQAVRASLSMTYPNSAVVADGQIVQIGFTDNITYEIVPVFVNTDESYTFPDSNNGGSWRTCKPKHEINEFATRDANCNRNLVELGRMARAWRDNNSVKMTGMLIDTLAYQFMGSWGYRDKSYLYYDYMTRDFFAFLGQQDRTQEKWPRLSEQLSPIYKWTAGGLQTVQSCPRWRSALATNRPTRWATRGAPWNSSYAAIATLGSLAK